MDTDTPLLQVSGLRVAFQGRRGQAMVLNGVDFDLRAGETLCVVGESGCGKSMTALALLRLIPSPPGRITGGQVRFQGEDLVAAGEAHMRQVRGNRISMIFQEPMTSLNPVLTVGEQIAEPLRLHAGLDAGAARQRAVEMLRQVGIPAPERRVHEYPHQFSGGMRQRVMIAMALACRPDILIADEPTTALDVTVQAQIFDLLRELQRDKGTAIVLITHDMGAVAEMADRVMVMYQGRVLETGPVRQVLDAPQQPYTQVLMGAIPSVHHRVQRLPVPEVGGGPAAPAVPWQPGAGAQEPAAALLEVRDLCKEFDLSSGWLARLLAREDKKILKAVDGVGFSIRRGSTFGLVGESGSGKSTVARMVAGLTPPTSGTVLFDGVDKWSPAAQTVAMRRRFQMIFQDPYASLNPRWTVQELIAEPLQVLALTAGKDETAERVQEALRRVRMKPDDARKYPHQFSGGQRQRIAIARALASRPEFIICDEPTSALDVSVQAQVLNLMRDLQEEFGLTYLLISHNLAVIRHMCDDIGVMQRGRLVETGEAGAVLDAPQHAYTRALMAAVPDMEHVH